LRSLQLDEDDELEYLFIIQGGPPPTSILIVANRESGSWYGVGRFDYWWHWNEEEAERLVEVHAPFLLIRETNGGSGISSTVARIYRMHNQRLHKTFEVEESSDSSRYGTHPLEVHTMSRDIRIRQNEITPWLVEVRQTHTIAFIDPDKDGDVKPQTTRRSCEGYEWVQGTFSFEPTKRAKSAVCK
jgi:hypothetical protein